MIDAGELTALVQQSLPDALVLVEDAAGTGRDFRLTIVARQFSGVSPEARQRLVRAALEPPLADGRVHSVDARTYSPDEWQKKNKLLYLE